MKDAVEIAWRVFVRFVEFLVRVVCCLIRITIINLLLPPDVVFV